MMNWLLWKDYRQNRVAFYSAAFFMLLPHLAILYVVCRETWLGVAQGHGQWADYFAGAALYGFVFSQLSIAVIGGNAFSGERVDRSAEFLFSLPISRGKIALSKLLVSLALILAIWLITSLILAGLLIAPTRWGASDPHDLADIWNVAACAAVVSTTFFCVAWCLSSFLTNATVAVLGGLITPLLVLSGIALTSYLLDLDVNRSGDRFTALFEWTCLTISPICFGLGTWYYLRRVEP
jgi:ABC-type transport system involved in multi-copper enzyme maturation permease subunit